MAKSPPPGLSAEDKALWEYEQGINNYLEDGPDEFSWLEDFSFEELGDLEQLGPTAYGDIKTDPRYDEYELDALRNLEEQADKGFTLRDEADLARVESQSRRNLRGQRDAISQNMAARGISGSGLEFSMAQKAAQDSAEMEALAGLEKAAMMQERKQGAAARLGTLGSQLKQNDFSRQARTAEARDAINRFNTANSVNRQIHNNQGRNDMNRMNLEGRQGTSNANVTAQNQFKDSALNARSGLAQTKYNKAVDDRNARLLREEERRRRRSGQTGAILGTAGAIAGGIYGGPAGAGAGYTIGSGLGQNIPSDERLKDNVKKEDDFDIEAFLRTIQPKSYKYKGDSQDKHGVVAQDLAGSKIGNDMLRQDENGALAVDTNDAVSALLEAVAYLNKKVEGRNAGA